jgi:CheY-like chemotaxis protein
VELTVSDTGAGIPPDILDRVFEPYFTTKPMGQGTGLGLSQVYGFAQQSGGLVRIESQLGVGTTAILALPVSKDLPAAPAVVEAPTYDAPGRDILLVEDDDGVADAVREMLEELGHRTIRASSAQAALDMLASNHRVDLVFSDIIMPGGMGGIELANEIERRTPDMPVLLTTGFGGTQDGDVGRPLLRKPYDIHALRAALTPLLRGRDDGGETNVVALRGRGPQ